MTRLTWSKPQERFYETGIDRGVLYLNDSSAVPWNGLSSVDENGGEDVSAYYIDGRPYLYVPKPKEFTANIKAYTYPDEFSSVLGIEEIVDGLYIDSQTGDSFHLSYRTFIGSMTQGTEAGRKIHLIYNATIAPSSISYVSLSNEINPVEFSWDIQAVPAAFLGARPSAHFIVDTRKIDFGRVRMLESILYGDETTDPRLPTPQELAELLAPSAPYFVGITEPLSEPLTDYTTTPGDWISDFVEDYI